MDDSLRAGLGQGRATCHSGGLSGLQGGRRGKKASCSDRTDVAPSGARHDGMYPGYDVCSCVPSQPH